MKLTIERAALLKALAHVQSVVERRNTIPILSNVLMEATAPAPEARETGGDGDGQLLLTATDMELTVVEAVAAEVTRAAAATAPAHTLYDIVRKLSDGAQIEISAGVETGQMALVSGRSNFTLATLPREDFPADGPLGTDAGDLPRRLSVAPADLRHLVDRTRFAISTEETRYYLNGIYLHAVPAPKARETTGAPEARDEVPPVLRAVATDGHRLARFEMPLPDGGGDMPGVILPRKAVGELRKLIDETDTPVEISLSDTKARFAFGHTVLTTKLIDGTFPDYERVIPSDNDKIMEVDRRSFASAVDRVSTISTEKSRAVKMAVAKGSLVLSATSPENGSATEEIEIDYDGGGIEIGFNSKYLLDIAQQIEGDRAQFELSDAASPTLVRDASDPSALYVLMPMRV